MTAGRHQSIAANAAPAVLASFGDTVRVEAERLRSKFGEKLPAASSSELYLIQGVGYDPFAPKSDPRLAVIYPPEFLFVLDVGLRCLVGGSVVWMPVGFGDPGFPGKNKIDLRSIAKRTEGNLIFPYVAGSIMIGIKEGTSGSEIDKEFSKYGLQDISKPDTFMTANCVPFEESSICEELEKNVPFVKYAEPNRIVRLIDFSPGWTVKRLL